ncbi:MAG: DUF177 domain-containing protein [Firmicutes bacterium]|nr:DUF177 domain-containing protein [Bacillota bacterium]
MTIDVKNVVSVPKDFSFEENITLPFSPSDIEGSVKVEGTVSKEGEKYRVKANIKACLNTVCDLCLEAFETKLENDIEEVYSETPDVDEESFMLENKTVDLKSAVIADILLNMPRKTVCSEDCKGLCPKCGKNLNEGDCGCDRGYVNPQFESLLTLFNDDKEV